MAAYIASSYLRLFWKSGTTDRITAILGADLILLFNLPKPLVSGRPSQRSWVSGCWTHVLLFFVPVLPFDDHPTLLKLFAPNYFVTLRDLLKGCLAALLECKVTLLWIRTSPVDIHFIKRSSVLQPKHLALLYQNLWDQCAIKEL